MGRRPGAAAESSGEGCSCSAGQQGQKESCLNVSHKAFPSARRSEYCGDCLFTLPELYFTSHLPHRFNSQVFPLYSGIKARLTNYSVQNTVFWWLFFFFNLAPPINKRLLYDLVHFIFTKSPKYLKDQL